MKNLSFAEKLTGIQRQLAQLNTIKDPDAAYMKASNIMKGIFEELDKELTGQTHDMQEEDYRNLKLNESLLYQYQFAAAISTKSYILNEFRVNMLADIKDMIRKRS